MLTFFWIISFDKIPEDVCDFLSINVIKLILFTEVVFMGCYLANRCQQCALHFTHNPGEYREFLVVCDKLSKSSEGPI